MSRTRVPSEEPPKQTANPSIDMYIGGKADRLSVKVSIDLPFPGNQENVEAIFMYLNLIHQVQLNPYAIQKDVVKLLLVHIGGLLELSCMAGRKREINTALYTYFQNLINEMPYHPIIEGYPGYAAYLEERRVIDGVIKLLDRQLTKKSLNLEDVALRMPKLVMTAARVNFRPELPTNFRNFLESINDTPKCRALWGEYFTKYEPYELSDYFYNQIQRQIEGSLISQELIEHFDVKFNRFVEALSKQTTHFSLAILKEVRQERRTPSPIAVVHTINRSTGLTNKTLTETLKDQLDAMLLDQQSFNENFAEFRRTLTEGLQEHEFLKDTLFEMLQTHLKPKPPVFHLFTLQSYLRQCETHRAHPFSDGLAVSFNRLQGEYQSARAASRQNYKYQFLTQLRDKIIASPERSPAECYRLVRKETSPEIRLLVDEPLNRFGFFTRHRFKDLMNGLLHEQGEVDYESRYAVSR